VSRRRIQLPLEPVEGSHLLREPFLQPFAVELQVPADDHRVVRAQDRLELHRRHALLAERFAPGWVAMALFYSSFALLSLICVRWLARREASRDADAEDNSGSRLANGATFGPAAQ